MPDKTYTCYLLITWQPIPVWFWVLRSVRGSSWSEQASADPRSSGEPTTFREATAEPEIFLKFNNIFPLPLSIILENTKPKRTSTNSNIRLELISYDFTNLASFLHVFRHQEMAHQDGNLEKIESIYIILYYIILNIIL
jgi:hypothetical protein